MENEVLKLQVSRFDSLDVIILSGSVGYRIRVACVKKVVDLVDCASAEARPMGKSSKSPSTFGLHPANLGSGSDRGQIYNCFHCHSLR
jgi:hypothetical protein